MKARYTGEAERDFVEIGAHIARDDLPTAIRFQAELEAFIERVASNPQIYRFRAEWGEQVRAARFGSYLVIFDIDGEEMVVLRIVNGRRNIARLLAGRPK